VQNGVFRDQGTRLEALGSCVWCAVLFFREVVYGHGTIVA
jgi:hypothetical protein